jgi:hypothetical protein
MIGSAVLGNLQKTQKALLVNSAGRFDSVSGNEFQENGKNDAGEN